jgi:hypothetical protein
MDRPRRLTGQACLEVIQNLAYDDSGDSSDEQDVLSDLSDAEYNNAELQSYDESDNLSGEDEPLPD